MGVKTHTPSGNQIQRAWSDASSWLHLCVRTVRVCAVLTVGVAEQGFEISVKWMCDCISTSTFISSGINKWVLFWSD